MPQLLDQSQGAFIQGRGTLENTHIVFEIIHSILSKNKRLSNERPYIAIKLDLAKT